jgi:hypothetical protein
MQIYQWDIFWMGQTNTECKQKAVYIKISKYIYMCVCEKFAQQSMDIFSGCQTSTG